MKKSTKVLKRLLGMMLVCATVLSLAACGCDGGRSTATSAAEYKAEYGESVKVVYDNGLVDASAAAFEENGKLTYAEATMLASRIHAGLNGKTVMSSSGEWYAPYYAYAAENSFGEITGDANSEITRGDLAVLLASAVYGKLEDVNSIASIPDVKASDAFCASVMSLYSKGITLGCDSRGYYDPYNTITHKESAEFISRIYGEKMVGKLDAVSTDDAYTLVINTAWDSSVEALAPGWQLDNRGGAPRTELYDNYGILNDISEVAGTALIRDFNLIETGNITLYSKLSLDGRDGPYMEFTNKDGKSVYRLEVKDGAWNLVIGGQYTKLAELGEKLDFDFRISIDLDNGRATTTLNNEDISSATLALSAEELNLASFKYATTEKGMAVMKPEITTMTANYALIESFSNPIDRNVYGWEIENARVGADVLNLGKGTGTAKVNFATVNGKVIAEFMFLNINGIDVKVSYGNGDRAAAVFTNTDGVFAVNGVEVYTTEYIQMWYRIRLELDTDGKTLLAKVNGRVVNESIPFADASVSSVNSLLIENPGATVKLDEFKVYRLYEREDYVPEPVVPKDSTGYNVGMNVCSLWRNGANWGGWSCISPYDDSEPVLGYYDEGLPETADWELKYMIEHGIDFQAFCIYMSKGSDPQRPSNADHLFEGFMNAKYSDMSKFCVIWECNAGVPNSIYEWKNMYVPFFIENYFKDPRYLTLDNKLLLSVFDMGKLAAGMGGEAVVKEAFEYLNEEVKSLGFDGVIYLANGSAANTTNGVKDGERMAAMGFDGCYAYNWREQGYMKNTNILQIRNSANSTDAVYTVPTVSVGFNSVAWHDVRYPMMTISDFEETHKWVRDTYLPQYAKEEWQKNLVWLSTWNEYGEGTYIMPTTDERGFGYLDVLRKMYTDEDIDPSLNVIPNAAQKYRINRLYPQDLTLLRRDGSYSDINKEGIKNIVINGKTFELFILNEVNALGDVLVAFDPDYGLDFALNIYHVWDRYTQTLTLNFIEHTVVYTVGKSTYMLDGVEKQLGFELYAVDNIPMIPIKQLCEDVGYTYSVNAQGYPTVTTK